MYYILITKIHKMNDTMEVQENNKFDYEKLKDYIDKNLSGSIINLFSKQNHEISNFTSDQIVAITDSQTTNSNQIIIHQFIHGQSNPTFHIKYKNIEIVLRKRPHGKLLKGAHQIDREYRMLITLHSQGFPVPKPIIYCSDVSLIGTEFYLMECVNGRILRNMRLPELSPDERYEIYIEFIRVLALLQSYDIKKLKLEDYGNISEDYFKRQITTWTRQYKSSQTDVIEDVESLISWLPQNIPEINSANEKNNNLCIVHGDFRLDNVIFHPTENKILAVLDWELSTIGPRIIDVTYASLMYYLPASFLGLGNLDKGLYGIPSEEEFKNIFFKLSASNKPNQSEWLFYAAFNCFRMAGIGQGVYKRALQGNNSSPYAMSFLSKTKQIAKIGYNCSRRSEIFKSIDKRIEDLKHREGLINFINKKLSLKFYITYLEIEDFMETFIFPNERKFFNLASQFSFNKLSDISKTDDSANKYKFNTSKKSSELEFFDLIENLKNEARNRGLWNLFLPEISGFTNLEYGLLCQLMGRSIFLAPEVFNCSAPDTGNMELLHKYANEEQKNIYLHPLLEGKIRSCFAMTEKGVASSDATNIKSSIQEIKNSDGSEQLIINGRKWWISGAGDPRCKFAIFMGVHSGDDDKSNKKQNSISSSSVEINNKNLKVLENLEYKVSHKLEVHKKHSMVIVPLDTPGVKIIRPMKVFGYDDAPHGHMDIIFNNVRVPKNNLILGRGRGFEMAQGRLGPGRIHHCMRILGSALRAIENMIDRVISRGKVFQREFSDNDAVLQEISKSKSELLQAQLMVLYAADKIDQLTSKGAKEEIALIKVNTPKICLKIFDRTMQLFGAEGLSQDTFLAYTWSCIRTLRIADGPDEVHMRSVGKETIKNFSFSPKF